MRKVFPCVALLLLSSAFVLGQGTEKVLYSFGGYQNDGQYADSSLVSDGAGNLYGTTQGGGTSDGGTVFELSPNSDGTWTESVLYSFCFNFSNCPDGDYASGLTIDKSGNLYGTTTYGGLDCSLQSPVGCGVAFELSPPGSGGGNWTYTVIYSFCSVGEYCDDGAGPVGPLAIDQSGNLYGTTFKGGQNQTQRNDVGAVFELSQSSGLWTESVLYSFCAVQQGGSCLDGETPDGVTLDKAGNLYGTTSDGGNPGSSGVLYKISQGPNGWGETVLRQLISNTDYEIYLGPISIDPKGNLYTTYTSTLDGQRYTDGFVVELTVNGGTREFRFDGSDGRAPEYGVILDPQRSALFGTTMGSSKGPGNVFEVDELGNETVLYNFCQQSGCADGSAPGGGLLEDQSENLFGVTRFGGTYGFGTVFEMTP